MGAPGPGSGSTARAPRGQPPSSGVAAVRARPSGGPAGHQVSVPSSAAHSAGVRRSGWMRRHRLASRAANPACPASSSPPSGSASHTATAATPVAARASSSSAVAMPVPSAAVSMAAAASPPAGPPLTAWPRRPGRPGAAVTRWPLLARAGDGWPVICAASSARLVPDSADRCSSCSWASAGEQPSRSISMPRARSTTDRAAAAGLQSIQLMPLARDQRAQPSEVGAARSCHVADLPEIKRLD